MTIRTASRPQRYPLPGALVGALLVAAAIYASLSAREWVFAAIAGAAGVELWRRAFAGPTVDAAILLDAVAFALFAYQRNDLLGFWQLAGPWADLLRLDVADAAIAYCVYLCGTLAALIGDRRALRPIEAIGLIAIPFLFKLIVLLGADWHMAEIGGFVGLSAFPAQTAVGRAVTLFVISEVGLQLLSLVGVDRPARRLRLHALLLAISVFAALTPLIANAAQAVASPVGAIVVGAVAAALAEAGLWGIVYFATGLTLDALSGRPPSVGATWGHLRSGAVRGAIYGGLFMLLVLAISAPLRQPAVDAFLLGNAPLVAPILGAIAFPLAQTLIGSADGTAPFFGRLRVAYCDARAWARGLVVGAGCWWAYAADVAHMWPSVRFCLAFVVGAVGLRRRRCAVRRRAHPRGRAAAHADWRGSMRWASCSAALSPGALGWYFDAAQIGVVWAKFWAYADVDYRARRPRARRLRHLSDLQQIRHDQPRRGRGRRAAVLRRVGRGRHQLVARRAALRDQRRHARLRCSIAA